MSRLVGNIAGRLGTTTLGVTQGPTGEFAWGSSGGVSPQQIFQTTANYTGETQSALGIFSVWFYVPTTFNETNLFLNFSDSIGVNLFNDSGLVSGTPRIQLVNASKTSVCVVTGTTVATGNTWHHLLVSWDVSAGKTFASDFHMYLDDVSIKPGSATAFVAGSTVEWGTGNLFVTNYRMGIGDSTTNAPSLRLAAWYLNYNAYLDFSVTSNRRKFITSSTLPAALGVDGSLPTGAQPLFYFDNPAASVLTNRGSAGDFQAGTTLVDAVGPNP